MKPVACAPAAVNVERFPPHSRGGLIEADMEESGWLETRGISASFKRRSH